MTPKQSGDTAFVAPSTLRTPVKKEHDDSLANEEAVLHAAEEKLLADEDEEISSYDEGGQPIVDTAKLENRMMTVAITRSVVDSTNYELRTRQQPKTVAQPQTPALKQEPASQQQQQAQKPRPTQKPQHTTQQQVHRPPVQPQTRIKTELPKPQTARISNTEGGSELTRRISQAAPPPSRIAKTGTSRLATAKAKTAAQRLIRPLVKPNSLPVPNPLANISTPTKIMIKHEPPTSNAPGTKPYTASSVPCPLPPVPCPLPASVSATAASSRPVLTKTKKAIQPPPRKFVAPVLRPPMPAAAPVPSAPLQPPQPHKRGRIFSIDIDPAGLDFPDMNMDSITSQEFSTAAPLPPISSTTTANVRPVTVASAALPAPTSSASKQVVFAAPDVGVVGRNGGRDRAMSFEFFSFGINADEPLPPAPEIPDMQPSSIPAIVASAPVVPMTRPRGDSIIFDPVSFQDGGIHEEKALAKMRTNPIDAILPGNDEMAIMNTPGFNPSVHNHTAATTSRATSSGIKISHGQQRSMGHHQHAKSSSISSSSQAAGAGQMATLPSSLNGTMNHATFQMDLLNKDGRIGIYLPEARKARIAKFHSKRKMRIWRKRIKYDCRK